MLGNLGRNTGKVPYFEIFPKILKEIWEDF